MKGASFDSTKKPLQELLADCNTGKLQLPDFQRGWVWDDDRIRNLIASVAVSYPIGAVMTLQTGSENVRFKPRPLAGTPPCLSDIAPETFILDGQQRLTSLYQVLKGDTAVETKDAKGKPIRRWYYIDMKKALIPDVDHEEVIISVPEDRIVKAFGGAVVLDMRTPEQEYAENLFPANRIFKSAKWGHEYHKYWEYDQEKVELFDEFSEEVIKRFEQYLMPVIEIKKETPKEAVCLVFERVNTGGVALTVFELLTASFAADNYQLRDDWNARVQRMRKSNPVLANIYSNDFLQVISLLVTQRRRREALDTGTLLDKAPGISCKRKDILKLEVADWQEWADAVEAGFKKAARFLYGEKIFKDVDIPYRTQLVPLTAILVALGNAGETDGVRRQIARWYWCGVLGELYGGATETRFARDLPEVITWVKEGGPEPISVQESSFQANRLLTLRTRNSSAYKGIYALLMRDGGRDFRTGELIEAQTYFDDLIDIHHIFPEKWCKDHDIDQGFYNSVINKTALSARTNRQIGGHAPSIYLPAIEHTAGVAPERMGVILRSHCIAPELLRVDNFWEFYAARAEELLVRIEHATGKSITREPSLYQVGTVMEVYDEGPLGWDEEIPMEVATL